MMNEKNYKEVSVTDTCDNCLLFGSYHCQDARYECFLIDLHKLILKAMIEGNWTCDTCKEDFDCDKNRNGRIPCAKWQPKKERSHKKPTDKTSRAGRVPISADCGGYMDGKTY